MASVYQRTNKDGSKVWRVVVRVKGHPTVCEHHERKQVAYELQKLNYKLNKGNSFPTKLKKKP